MDATSTGQETPVPFQGNLARAFVDGLSLGVQGIRAIGGMFATWRDGLALEGSSAIATISLSLAIVLVALLLGMAARRAAFAVLPRRSIERDDIIGRLRRAPVPLIADVLGFAVFLAVGQLVLMGLAPGGTLMRLSASAILNAAATALLYAIAGRLLFAPYRAEVRLITIDNPGWHWSMLLAYGAVGGIVGQTVRLAHALDMDPMAIEGWFLAGATILTIQKLWWFIRGGRDIARAFAGTNPGPTRRAAAVAVPAFYVVSALLIWAAGCLAAGKPQSSQWSFAAGATQVVLLVLPILGLGAHAISSAMIEHRKRGAGFSPMTGAIAHGLQTLVTGGIWLLGVHLIVELWNPIMTVGGAYDALTLVSGLRRVLLTLVGCWAVWSFLRSYFEAIAPAPRPHLPGEDVEESAGDVSSRLSTVLPLVRNIAFAGVLAISTLIVLSSLGVDIAPLLAGFGILGLAVSFGSQALVRDIVSGIFFIADDAFRIGEYLDTGKLKGTVERISLRSIQLRHQNGPLHTIPFGQLQSVTNFSRDWGTVKFELRFDRDTDPERIRKVVKKIGLELLEHEEFGKEFLVPLKMQGIQDVTDNSLVVRLKFTVKPGNPSMIQREAMKRLLPAFKQSGLLLASNAVTVRSGADELAAAAADNSLKLAKAASANPKNQEQPE